MPKDHAPQDQGTQDLGPHRVWHQGGARPVLALHCSLAHAGAWSGLAAHLTGVTLTALDQPGHGRAAAWTGPGDLHDRATAEALALTKSLGQPVDLIGHSFGGTVALRLALHRPDLVRSLTLVEPVLFAAARGSAAFAGFAARHAAFGRLIAAGQDAEALRLFHGDWGNGQSLEDLPPRILSYMLARIGLIAVQTPVLLEDSAQLLRPGALEALDLPVQMIRGAQSPAVVQAIHASLGQRLPRAVERVVPGAGHMLPISHAAEVAALVLGFWGGL